MSRDIGPLRRATGRELVDELDGSQRRGRRRKRVESARWQRHARKAELRRRRAS